MNYLEILPSLQAAIYKMFDIVLNVMIAYFEITQKYYETEII
jgi:hypothetical protein